MTTQSIATVTYTANTKIVSLDTSNFCVGDLVIVPYYAGMKQLRVKVQITDLVKHPVIDTLYFVANYGNIQFLICHKNDYIDFDTIYGDAIDNDDLVIYNY